MKTLLSLSSHLESWRGEKSAKETSIMGTCDLLTWSWYCLCHKDIEWTIEKENTSSIFSTQRHWVDHGKPSSIFYRLLLWPNLLVRVQDLDGDTHPSPTTERTLNIECLPAVHTVMEAYMWSLCSSLSGMVTFQAKLGDISIHIESTVKVSDYLCQRINIRVQASFWGQPSTSRLERE